MILKVLIFITAFVMVSSKDEFRNSSAYLHIASPLKQIAFMDLGEYSGQTAKGIRYKKNYYFSKYFTADWTSAKSICKSFGLELATFETSNEAHFFLNRTADIDYFSKFDYKYVLVDGITLTPKSTSDWYWTNSGEKIPYTIPWAKGEPNNGYNDENCLSIGRQKRSTPLGFNDYRCSSASTHFICQKTKMT